MARFGVEHDFDAPREAVAALLIDPDFMTGVELPDLALPTVVAHSADARGASLQLRYEYVGQLDPIAKRAIGSRSLTWIQDFRYDRETFRGDLTIIAESMPDKLKARAEVQFVATSLGCRRAITGDFSVRIPLVGSLAEKAILPGVLRRLDVEADAVRARLGQV
jgi:hypothetical protein